MHSVLFAGPGPRSELFEEILIREGCGTRLRFASASLSDADLAACRGSAIIFIDLILGTEAARSLVKQLRTEPSVGWTPLVALIGDTSSESFDQLIDEGADLCVSDDPRRLVTRTRFLRDALKRRSLIAQSEAKYRSVVSVLDEGIVVRGKDGAIETINDSVMRIVGIDRPFLVEENWKAPSDLSMVREDGTPLGKHEQPGFRALATGERIRNFVCGLVRSGRDTVWMSLNASPLRDPHTGEVTGSVTSMRDVSLGRRAEDEFLALLDRAPASVLIHRDARILWVNRATVALMGYSTPSDLIGRTLYELLPARIIPIIEQRMRDRAAGVDAPAIQHPILRSDGTEVDMEIIGIPTIFQGSPAVIAYGRDLTKEREMEAQLIANDRLAALGRLAASVGHEINNPLTYLIGSIELAIRRLRASPESPPSTLSALGDALDGAARVRDIVADMRVFAQRPSDDASAIDAAAVISSCLRISRGEIVQRARLVVEVAPLPHVRGNEPQLAHVITNILLNAAHACSEGDPATHRVSVRARVGDDGRVEVLVEDTGAGIAPEHMPLVFEPLFTTKLRRAGGGLGLASSRTLVAAMGGEISLTSELGRGTQVLLRLPAASRVADPPQTCEPQKVGERRRILVVDDEVRIAELFRELLAGHDVTVATAGAAALAVLTVDSDFDAILCDLMMPGTDGIDLHEYLRTNRPGVEHRIVFMTGGATTPRVAAFLANVSNRCLAKPFAADILLRTIQEVAAEQRR